MSGLSVVCLSLHAPRICNRDAAGGGPLLHEQFRSGRDAMVAQGDVVRGARPDVLVVTSCHLVSTFPTVVVGTKRHRGILTAMEAPDQIRGVVYDLPGHADFAAALAARARSAGRLVTLVDDVNYPLDYGTVMPFVCYLDPAATIPVVPVSTCLCSDLGECFEWGRDVTREAWASGLTVGFVATGSLSHRIVRGPERRPRPDDEARDHEFAGALAGGDYAGLWKALPDYVEASGMEAEGRHLAMMLGALVEAGRPFRSVAHGYAAVSGSGNYVISLLGNGARA